jgi:hypothetical protein
MGKYYNLIFCPSYCGYIDPAPPQGPRLNEDALVLGVSNTGITLLQSAVDIFVVSFLPFSSKFRCHDELSFIIMLLAMENYLYIQIVHFFTFFTSGQFEFASQSLKINQRYRCSGQLCC